MIRTEEIWDEIERHGLSEYVSRYEIWYNKDELKELSERYRLLSKRRYILPTIAYFLFILPVPTGIAIAYLGILWNQGGRVIWGSMIFLIGLIYLIAQYKVVKNMENHLFKEGIGSAMSRWDFKLRKTLMKRLGKRYWFAYLPFSAIEYMETKDLTSETSALLIHTKDGKVWPHPKYGVPYNRTLKGDVKFINEILKQYGDWSKKNAER